MVKVLRPGLLDLMGVSWREKVAPRNYNLQKLLRNCNFQESLTTRSFWCASGGLTPRAYFQLSKPCGSWWTSPSSLSEEPQLPGVRTSENLMAA